MPPKILTVCLSLKLAIYLEGFLFSSYVVKKKKKLTKLESDIHSPIGFVISLLLQVKIKLRTQRERSQLGTL